MRFLVKARQVFGRGVSLAMDVPQDFAWEDKSIPLRVHITSHQPQSDRNGALRFHFYDEDKGVRSNTGTENGVNHRWEMNTPIELTAGASQVLQVEMPLPFNTDDIAALTQEFKSSSAIGEKLAGALMLGNMSPPTHLQWFRLRVSLRLEGMLLSARTSEKIRCRNAKARFSLGPLQL